MEVSETSPVSSHSFSNIEKKTCFGCCVFVRVFFKLFVHSLPLNLSSVLQDGYVELQQVGNVHQKKNQSYRLYYSFCPPRLTDLTNVKIKVSHF